MEVGVAHESMNGSPHFANIILNLLFSQTHPPESQLLCGDWVTGGICHGSGSFLAGFYNPSFPNLSSSYTTSIASLPICPQSS